MLNYSSKLFGDLLSGTKNFARSSQDPHFLHEDLYTNFCQVKIFRDLSKILIFKGLLLVFADLQRSLKILKDPLSFFTRDMNNDVHIGSIFFTLLTLSMPSLALNHKKNNTCSASYNSLGRDISG